jgi:hypothetical protein
MKAVGILWRSIIPPEPLASFSFCLLLGKITSIQSSQKIRKSKSRQGFVTLQSGMVLPAKLGDFGSTKPRKATLGIKE